MPQTEGKKSTPFVMVLVLMTAVMPFSLQALGVNFSISDLAGSALNTWGRTMSFVSCTYQPTLVAELIALSKTLPCEQKFAPKDTVAPASEQLACLEGQVTIDPEVFDEPLPLPGIDALTVSESVPTVTAVPRQRRAMGRIPVVTASPEPVFLPSDEVSVETAIAEVDDTPEPNFVKDEKWKGFEMRFITKPVFSNRQATALAQQVKAVFGTDVKTSYPVNYEKRMRYAERVEYLKLNCNFKALKALQEAEAGKPVTVVVRERTKSSPRAVEIPIFPEPNFTQF